MILLVLRIYISDLYLFVYISRVDIFDVDTYIFWQNSSKFACALETILVTL